jgi:hypothetical protein
VEDEKPDGPADGAVLPADAPAAPTEAAAPADPGTETLPPAVLMPQTVLPAAVTPATEPPAVATPERPMAASPPRDPAPRVERSRSPRPNMVEPREPLFRETGGYRLRLDPADLARLRELPGSKEKTDRELGEMFFDAHSERLTGAVADDVPAPAELRVVVDPFSRQAFLALGRTIRGIVSF